MAEKHTLHPVLGHGGAHRDVWLLYRPETGAIVKAFLTEPDPAALGAPPGHVLGRFHIEDRVFARIGSYRVLRGRVVMRVPTS